MLNLHRRSQVPDPARVWFPRAETAADSFFAGGGFEQQEESVWRAGPTDIGFRTDTYGDADGVEIDLGNLARCRLRLAGRIDDYAKVGNPLGGNPFVHCPTFEWEITGEELLPNVSRAAPSHCS